MTVDVISHRRPRRKRGWAYAARRVGAVALTLAALATAHLLAPRIGPHPAPPAPAPAPEIAMPAPAPALQEIDVTLDLAAAPAAPRPRRARRARPSPRGVPLDASASLASDAFEVLSAAELAAISQARD